MQLRSAKMLLMSNLKLKELPFDIIIHIATFLPFKDFVKLSLIEELQSPFGRFRKWQEQVLQHPLFFEALIDRGALTSLFLDFAIEFATIHSKLDICKVLIRKGADLNRDNPSFGGHWFTACRYGGLSVIRLFIENGMDVNYVDDANRNGLMIAIYHICNLQKVNYLINSGCRLDLISASEYDSCLHIAARTWKIAIYLRLLDLGIDSTLMNRQGMTAVMMLVERLGNVAKWKTIYRELMNLKPNDLLRREREIVEELARR